MGVKVERFDDLTVNRRYKENFCYKRSSKSYEFKTNCVGLTHLNFHTIHTMIETMRCLHKSCSVFYALSIGIHNVGFSQFWNFWLDIQNCEESVMKGWS